MRLLLSWKDERWARYVIPAKRYRTRPAPHNPRRYRQGWRIEAAIGCLKDFRRVATRHDKLARTFHDAVTLAAIIAFWI